MSEKTKVVYNACFGGFGLSLKAQQAYANAKGFTLFFYSGVIRGPYQRVDESDDSQFCVFAFKNDLGDSPSSDDVNSKGEWFHDGEIDRADPDLVRIVEEMGDAANGSCAKLKIEELPKGTLYRIDEYDGNESVMTQEAYDWRTA